MAYPNALEGFIIPKHTENWPLEIQYVPEPPRQIRGSLNPWELETKRLAFAREEQAWKDIKALQVTYRSLERDMKVWANEFNGYLAELERVVGKKVGMGPIGSYTNMALAIIPGFGWVSAVFSAVSMLLEMLGGNKKKKRVNELVGWMEERRRKLAEAQGKLQAIQQEMVSLTHVAEGAKAERAAQTKASIRASQGAYDARRQREKEAGEQRAALVKQIRQMHPVRVLSPVDDL